MLFTLAMMLHVFIICHDIFFFFMLLYKYWKTHDFEKLTNILGKHRIVSVNWNYMNFAKVDHSFNHRLLSSMMDDCLEMLDVV